MSRPDRIRARDLPDPDGSRFGIPTYYWGTAPAELGETERQLMKHDPPLRPGNKKDKAAQVLRPRKGNREPLTAYLFRVEDAVPKRPATPAELDGLAKGRRTQQIQAMERHGVDPAEFEDLTEESGPGWFEDEAEDLELEESG